MYILNLFYFVTEYKLNNERNIRTSNDATTSKKMKIFLKRWLYSKIRGLLVTFKEIVSIESLRQKLKCKIFAPANNEL